MLKYDSTHGTFRGSINVLDESTLEVNGKPISITCARFDYNEEKCTDF